MSNPALLFEVGADTSGFEGSMSKILSLAKGTVAGFVGFGSAAAAFKKMYDGAVETEQAFSKLKIAVKNSKDGSLELYNQMTKLSDEMGRLGKFSDDEAASALAILTSTTRSSKVAMEALLPTMQMATEKEMSLEQAARLVGRAYESGTRLLGKYGVVTAQNVKGQEALNVISKRFAGSIQENMTTTAGIAKNTQNNFNSLMGDIGSYFTPAIDAMNTELGEAIDRFRDFFKITRQVKDDPALVALKNSFANLVNETERLRTDVVALELSKQVAAASIANNKYLKSLQAQKAAEQAIVDYQNNVVQSYNNKGAAADDTAEKIVEAEKKAAKAAGEAAAAASAAAKTKIDADKDAYDTIVSNRESTMGTLSTLMNSKNQQMFEVGKAAAVANATIQTAQGAVNAYTSLSSIPVIGPELGLAAAAALAIYGAEQISTIASTTFNPEGAATGLYNDTNESMISTFQPSEIVIPQRFSEMISDGKMALTGANTTNNNGTVNLTFNILSNGLDNAKTVTKDQIIPELKNYFINERGGIMGRVTNSGVVLNV